MNCLCVTGDLKKDLGLAALPERQKEFDEKLETSIEYAKALDCKWYDAGKQFFLYNVCQYIFYLTFHYSCHFFHKHGYIWNTKLTETQIFSVHTN